MSIHFLIVIIPLTAKLCPLIFQCPCDSRNKFVNWRHERLDYRTIEILYAYWTCTRAHVHTHITPHITPPPQLDMWQSRVEIEHYYSLMSTMLQCSIFNAELPLRAGLIHATYRLIRYSCMHLCCAYELQHSNAVELRKGIMFNFYYTCTHVHTRIPIPSPHTHTYSYPSIPPPPPPPTHTHTHTRTVCPMPSPDGRWQLCHELSS